MPRPTDCDGIPIEVRERADDRSMPLVLGIDWKSMTFAQQALAFRLYSRGKVVVDEEMRVHEVVRV